MIKLTKNDHAHLFSVIRLIGAEPGICKTVKPESSGKFDYWAGELNGKVRAKATGNSLLVTLVSYKTGAGERDNYFTREYATFQPNSQIFVITKNGSKYEAKPVGKMENILDGTCTISVTK